MKVLIVFTLAAAVAATEYPKQSYPATYTKSYEYPAASYDFAWAVKDEPSYNDYSHKESSDGKIVSGSYRVLLPDDRVQTVTYKADDNSGYVAEVKYEGEAKYDYKPDYKTAYTTPYTAPAYPTPAYPAYPTTTAYPDEY